MSWFNRKCVMGHISMWFFAQAQQNDPLLKPTITGDKNWIVSNKLVQKMKWVTVNHSKSWSAAKECNAVQVAGLENLCELQARLSTTSEVKLSQTE